MSEVVELQFGTEILKILLKDHTTKKNILWATNDYENISAEEEIQVEQLDLIQPRYKKIREQQKSRTREKAEVFTPTIVCELQNNAIDESFGEIFWQDYISKTILEITCGEVPYLANRYDAVTGEKIEIKNRVGMLDRKLKVIGENFGDSLSDVEEWNYWAKKAVQSVYGYEFQGDSLFLARLNIISTVQEFFEDKFKYSAPTGFLKEIAKIIAWNLWQMDGLTYTIPFHKIKSPQSGLKGFEEKKDKECEPCKVIDWKKNPDGDKEKFEYFIDWIKEGEANGKF